MEIMVIMECSHLNGLLQNFLLFSDQPDVLFFMLLRKSLPFCKIPVVWRSKN